MTDDAPVRATPLTSTRLVGALEFIVKVVAIGVPILYALGRLYSESYWQELQLPASLMDYAAEDYLYFGFTSLVNGLARLVGIKPYAAMGYAVVAAGGAALLMIAIALVDRWAGNYLKQRKAKLQQRITDWTALKHGWFIKHVGLGVAVGAGALFAMLFLITATLFLFLPIIFAVTEGKRQAQSERVRLTQPQREPATAIKPQPVAHYIIDGTRSSALMSECSESWCVIFQQGAFVAIPRSDVYRVDQVRPGPSGN